MTLQKRLCLVYLIFIMSTVGTLSDAGWYAAPVQAESSGSDVGALIITSSANNKLWLIFHNDSIVFSKIIYPEKLTIESKFYPSITVFNETFNNVTVIRSGSEVVVDGNDIDDLYKPKNLVDEFDIIFKTWYHTMISIFLSFVMVFSYILYHRKQKSEVLF